MINLLLKARRFRKKAFPIVAGALAVLLPVTIFILTRPQKVSAAWFNTGWLYRTRIAFTNGGSADANKKVRFTIDTALLYSAGKIKADCSDSRFTDINGRILQYYLDTASGACNTAATVYWVLVPSIITGDNVIYHYYGNPTATAGTQASQFSQATFTPEGSSATAEEKSPGPALWYKFDEGAGTVVYDSTAQRRDATMLNALWTPEVCVSGKCLQFNAFNSVVTASSAVNYVQTVAFWIRPTTAGTSIVDFDGGTHTVTTAGGVVSANGFSSPVIYINGKVDTAVTVGSWNFVEITTTTPFNATALSIGKVGSSYFNGFIDEFRLYQYIRTASQVKADYAARGSISGVDIVTIEQPYGVVNLNLKTGAVTGKAYFISTASYLDFSANSSNVTVNTSTGVFSGYAFSGDLGWVAFGSADNAQGPVRLNFSSGRVTGKALVLNTGAYLDFSGYNSLTMVSTATGAFYGYAYSEDLGWANFGIADNPPSGAVVLNLSTRAITGKAYGLNTVGYLDFTNYSSNTSISAKTGAFTGFAFSEDLGWVDFSTVKLNGSTGAVTGQAVVLNTGSTIDFTNYGSNVLVNLKTGYFSGYAFSQDIGWLSFGVPGAVELPFTGHNILYYNFDEGYGTTAHNKGQATGSNGSISGASWSNLGKYNKALTFNGSSSEVTVTNNSFIELDQGLSGGFTISAWVYANSDGENHVGQIFSKGVNTYLRVSGQSGLNLNLDASADLTTTDATLSLSAPLKTATWNYVALEYNASVSQITLYVNGRNMGSSTNGFGSLAAETNNLVIGGSAGAHFNGLLDEVKVFNYPLSDGEIKVDYNHAAGLQMGSGDNSASRAYCPPGNVEGNCANSQNPAPVAEWNFDEGNGTSVSDTSGNNYTGTWGGTGTHWTTGHVGKAGKFNGSDDYVSMGDILDTTIDSNFTVSIWTKVGTLVNDWTSYLFFKGGTWNSYFAISVNQLYGSPGTIRIEHNNDKQLGNSTKAIADNKWHLVTVTRDRSVGAIKIFIDGKIDKTLGDITYTDSSNLIIGRANAASRLYNGFIDQVAVYNYARTPAQIAWDYNRGEPVARYKLDECSGTTIRSTNTALDTSLNGTLTVGASGTQTSAGTCSSGSSLEAWNNGTTGKINSSLNFDGTDDYITVNSTLGNFGTADFSVSGWLKTSGTARYIMGKRSGCSHESFWNLKVSSTGKLEAEIDQDSGGTNYALYTGSKTINDNSWHQFTLVRQGSTLTGYIDGKPDSTASGAGTANISNAASLLVANSPCGSLFQGQLDDVRLYNYALTSTQAKDLYNGGAVKFGQ